jgi:hypothetical protein
MIADGLARRVWLFDGDLRKVEVWLRRDGTMVVSRLVRVDPNRRVWREEEHAVVVSEAAALRTASDWIK